MSVAGAYQEAVRRGNKKALLDFLNNAMPYASPDGNLQVAILDQKTGFSSKWKSWWEIRDNTWWVEHINQRLIGLPEIIIDIDPEAFQTEEEFKTEIKNIKLLKNDMLKVLNLYNTGSRGIHIHLFYPPLNNMTIKKRERWKKQFIKKSWGDKQKNADRCMIALEGSKHWKTGNRKCTR